VGVLPSPGSRVEQFRCIHPRPKCNNILLVIMSCDVVGQGVYQAAGNAQGLRGESPTTRRWHAASLEDLLLLHVRVLVCVLGDPPVELGVLALPQHVGELFVVRDHDQLEVLLVLARL
jgi:hypothetical protein